MQVITQDDPAADEGKIDTILHVGPIFNKPLCVEVQLDGKLLTMELDMGVAMSLVSEATYRIVFLVKRHCSSLGSSCTHIRGSR